MLSRVADVGLGLRRPVSAGWSPGRGSSTYRRLAAWRVRATDPSSTSAEQPVIDVTAEQPGVPAEATGKPAAKPSGLSGLSEEWVKEVVTELTDTSKLGSRGEGWFVAQLLVCLLVIFPPAGLKIFVDTVGWLLVFAGFGMMVAGQQALGRNLTPLPKPRDSNQLVTEGIYKYCRHPMYGGIVVAAAGLTMATGNEVRLVMTLVAALVLSEKASYEERFLEELHPEYADYTKRTKKLIPYIF